MKILIATNHSYMLYRFRRELIEELGKTHEVVLSMPFVGHQEDFQNMGFRCIPMELDRRSVNPLKDAVLLSRYRRLLKEVAPDLVITYSIKPNIYLGALCRLMGIPYFANVQGLGTAFEKPVLSTLVSFMYRFALGAAGGVFFENQENARSFVNRKIVSESVIKVLPGAGINLEQYPYADISYDGVCRFLYLGRIMREKGMDELFEASCAIKAKYGDRVAFDLVGFYEDSYKETVEKLVADGVIRFHGFQTEVHPYYREASCVVMPSYHEGMSNVLLEGAATGRALITTDIPGCREAVRDGVTGYLCAPHSTAALQQAMESFLGLSQKQQKEMGYQGRLLVEELFDKKRVVEETVAWIRYRMNRQV